ncbi:acyl-CoA Delta(11) desaturase-like [Copidosoma floridanum]|uniref:acyl-CoA Delta(11) desaturase-like n=1 Tax=Copidosoma floridanum TaxID=29053 RepID=UPI0006C9A311|nr:acyl-CoA Delta(11) desaturase-like [Copidosoma floridanum]
MVAQLCSITQKIIKILRPKALFSKYEIKWTNVVLITLFHLVALYGLLTFPYIQKYKTVLFAFILTLIAGFGVTGGVHRYWTHKAYKAKLPLKIILVCCYTLAGQNSIYDWVRDHRIHHKFTETDADPHNSKRGFFFSHVGWLFIKKHPDVIEKGIQMDMSDIENDPIVNFANKHFTKLKLLFAFVSVAVPVYVWNESWYYSAMAQLVRFIYTSNVTWSVNSLAHIWGTKPYNKNIAPVENSFVTYITNGEGWHNFHHVFPFDYRCPEFAGRHDPTAKVIEIFAKIGWAYDLRKTKDSMITSTLMKHGDETIKSQLS